MRATIVVRHVHTDQIAQLFEVPSIDENTVNEAVRGLEQRYPRERYRIDTSQVKLARQHACAA